MDSPRVDLLLTYDWPYDGPFLALLDRELALRGRSLLTVGPARLEEVRSRLDHGELRARAFLDRAADTSPAFEPLEVWAAEHIPVVLNPLADRRRVWRKSNLHGEFIRTGVHTPYTHVVPAWSRQAVVDPIPDLALLGGTFAIKPDLGGGGWGVTLGARSWEQVERARREMPDEDLLLQEHIEPARLEGRRAWFRVFYACGETVACWWNDRTRCFGPLVVPEERRRLALEGLWEIAGKASEIARLQLFSTEIALSADGRWVVVDYVNDPVDLRILGHAQEGMPAEAAERIASAAADYVARLA